MSCSYCSTRQENSESLESHKASQSCDVEQGSPVFMAGHQYSTMTHVTSATSVRSQTLQICKLCVLADALANAGAADLMNALLSRLCEKSSGSL